MGKSTEFLFLWTGVLDFDDTLHCLIFGFRRIYDFTIISEAVWGSVGFWLTLLVQKFVSGGGTFVSFELTVVGNLSFLGEGFFCLNESESVSSSYIASKSIVPGPMMALGSSSQSG